MVWLCTNHCKRWTFERERGAHQDCLCLRALLSLASWDQCWIFDPATPSTLLYYISQVIWVSKYSTGWWPHIRWGRLEMKLPRPNYTKLDPVFCKKGGFYIFQSKAFFLGSCRSLFWALGGSFLGPWAVCQKGGGGLPKRRGGFKERISCRAPVTNQG